MYKRAVTSQEWHTTFGPEAMVFTSFSCLSVIGEVISTSQNDEFPVVKEAALIRYFPRRTTVSNYSAGETSAVRSSFHGSSYYSHCGFFDKFRSSGRLLSFLLFIPAIRRTSMTLVKSSVSNFRHFSLNHGYIKTRIRHILLVQCRLGTPWSPHTCTCNNFSR